MTGEKGKKRGGDRAEKTKAKIALKARRVKTRAIIKRDSIVETSTSEGEEGGVKTFEEERSNQKCKSKRRPGERASTGKLEALRLGIKEGGTRLRSLQFTSKALSESGDPAIKSSMHKMKGTRGKRVHAKGKKREVREGQYKKKTSRSKLDQHRGKRRSDYSEMERRKAKKKRREVFEVEEALKEASWKQKFYLFNEKSEGKVGPQRGT